MSFLQTRASLVVDSDLLECYKAIDEDISHLLSERRVRAIRQADIDRTIKCEDSEGLKTAKCGLYASERCKACSVNRGIVLMRRFDREIEELVADADIRQFWDAVKFPHISEIHRLTQTQSHHLLTTSTSQLISSKAVRKVRGARPGSQSSRFSWSEVNANRVSNTHILGLLEQSSQK
jgi:hypothetical protein